MLENTTYTCSYCGLEWDTKEGCATHEEMHRNLKLNPGDLVWVSFVSDDDYAPWVIVREVLDDYAYVVSVVSFYSDRLSDQHGVEHCISRFNPLYVIPKKDVLELEEEAATLRLKCVEELSKVAGFMRVAIEYHIEHTTCSLSLHCQVRPEFKNIKLSTGKQYKLIQA